MPDVYEERRGPSPILVVVPLLIAFAGWMVLGMVRLAQELPQPGDPRWVWVVLPAVMVLFGLMALIFLTMAARWTDAARRGPAGRGRRGVHA